MPRSISGRPIASVAAYRPTAALAKKWFERAARAGHLDAQVSLGLLLFDIGDRAGALTWLGKAAESGDPRAMLVTGTALFNGDGLKRDPVLGYAYVSRAAAQGLAPAKATLADMDKVLPLADRQKGVALALRLAGTAPVTKPAPKIPGAEDRKRRAENPASRTLSPPGPPRRSRSRDRVAGGSSLARSAIVGRHKPCSRGSRPGWAARRLIISRSARLPAFRSALTARPTAAAACARLKPQPCFAVAAK